MKKIFLFLAAIVCTFTLSAQSVFVDNGEGSNLGFWWPAGSTGFVDTWDNPAKDEVNSTDKAMTIWMNNGSDIWTGGGMGALNIDTQTYNSISVMIYKQVVGKVQVELQSGDKKVYVIQEYTTPGKWQKLEFSIPIGFGNITTLLVAPHLENTNENPLPEDESRRIWWDEVEAFYNPNATSAAFVPKTLATSDGETLNYREMSPATVEAGKKIPLVIFLHGAGERGSDNARQLTLGADLFAKNRETYPAFILFPQCPDEHFWPFETSPASTDATTFPVDYTISTPIKYVKEMIDKYLAMPEVDKDRVYIAGLSMGGMGTFDIACRFPGIFAAAVPICGGVNVDRLTSDVDSIYWRLFHGDQDNDVPVENSRTAYNKLLSLEANVEYIEEAGVAHDVWNNAFAREDFLPWLFSKTRQTTVGIEESEGNTIGEVVSTQIYSLSGNLLTTLENGKTLDQSALAKGAYIIKETDKNDKLRASKQIKVY